MVFFHFLWPRIFFLQKNLISYELASISAFSLLKTVRSDMAEEEEEAEASDADTTDDTVQELWQKLEIRLFYYD